MNLQEIKKAVREGKTVHWSNESYKVIEDREDHFLVKCTLNNHCVGLTNRKTGELIEYEEKFFIQDDSKDKIIVTTERDTNLGRTTYSIVSYPQGQPSKSIEVDDNWYMDWRTAKDIANKMAKEIQEANPDKIVILK